MAGNQVMSDGMKAKRAAMRRATLQLILGVGLLHGAAILTWYAAIIHSPQRTKNIYVWIWLIATAFVVAILLKRVRRVRHSRTSP